MATVELTQTDVGEFEAEKIQSFSSKKLVHLKGVYTHGYVLPEQGTWHLERKKKILLKHPEVKQLYGQNPWTAVLMVFFLAIHTWVAVKVSTYSFPVILIASYTLGSWWSFVLQAIGHEATHRLVFKSAVANKIVAMLAFLPVFHGAFGTIWMYEHMWHHNVVVDKCIRYGEQQNGTIKKMIMTLLFIVLIDLVVAVSGTMVLVSSIAGLALYLAGKQSHILPKTCALPPYKTFTQAINVMTLINIVLSFSYHIILYRYAGGWAWFYVAISSYWCNGLHPLGMRQVQEHYFVKKDQPTYSVYTPVHLLCLNLGHHVEHHDFPTIPWNRLPALRALAPEFYDTLYYHKSYTQVLWDFLTSPGIPLSILFEDSVLSPEALATSEAQFSS